MVDLAALVAQKDELLGRLRQAKYADVATAYGFEVRPQVRPASATPDTLVVDGQVLRAGAYMVATGAEPAAPELPGLEEIEYLTSTTAMELLDLPQSLVVIGGGHVGTEQAQFFAHLDVDVKLAGRLAPRAEPELAQRLRQVFADDGVTVVEEHAARVESVDSGVAVITASGRRITGDRRLVAAGRRARTDGLDVSAAGIEVDERGFVVVDAQQRTTNHRVWAAGDVNGAPQCVCVAAAAGRVAATPTPWASVAPPPRLTTPGCPRSCSPAPGSPRRGSPRPRPGPGVTGASLASWTWPMFSRWGCWTRSGARPLWGTR